MGWPALEQIRHSDRRWPTSPSLSQARFPLILQTGGGLKEVLETWRNAHVVCFDMNSNVCLDEGSDELAGFCAAGQAVDEWTAKAMTGTVPFEEAPAAWILLSKPTLS